MKQQKGRTLVVLKPSKHRPSGSGDVEQVLTSPCPWCGEPFEVLADLAGHTQSFVEDCQCCCRPIQVSFRSDGAQAADLRFERA